MRKLFALTLLTLSLVGCQLNSPDATAEGRQVCCGGQSSTPDAATESNIVSHSLGIIPRGPEIAHQFAVLNRSDSETAVISQPPQYNLPCCVDVELSQREIAPGETATLTVTFKTRDRPGPFDILINLLPEHGDVAEHYHLNGRVEEVLTEPRPDFHRDPSRSP